LQGGNSQLSRLLSQISDSEKVAFFDDFWRGQTGKQALAMNRKDDDRQASANKEQATVDLQFHPLYGKDAQKVTLISSDGKAFCTDKQILSTHR
jgi:hypothetical protein